MNWRRHLLWIDCTAGGLVGVLVLGLHRWLSDLYGLPEGFVLAMGVANLAYAAFSFSLARRRQRPLARIKILADLNVTWGGFLISMVFAFAPNVTEIGTAMLISEGIFVGGLGLLEWRHREFLLRA